MEKKGYAISSWHNTEKIYAGLDHLMKQPTRPVKREAMEKVMDYFDTKCVKSKEMVTEEDLVQKGQEQKEISEDNSYTDIVTLLMGSYYGVLFKWLEQEGSRGSVAELERSLQLVFHGIKVYKIN
ncbi:hypothetical protein VQL36_18275 [Chengkuizengella sp. SCS-71B]|uniref:hypothetical protein n=1 Tax=Chengkuizengella sp. SCS-71B TaxID=3115290 RepID=UPI0032C21286